MDEKLTARALRWAFSFSTISTFPQSFQHFQHFQHSTLSTDSEPKPPKIKAFQHFFGGECRKILRVGSRKIAYFQHLNRLYYYYYLILSISLFYPFRGFCVFCKHHETECKQNRNRMQTESKQNANRIATVSKMETVCKNAQENSVKFVLFAT